MYSRSSSIASSVDQNLVDDVNNSVVDNHIGAHNASLDSSRDNVGSSSVGNEREGLSTSTGSHESVGDSRRVDDGTGDGVVEQDIVNLGSVESGESRGDGSEGSVGRGEQSQAGSVDQRRQGRSRVHGQGSHKRGQVGSSCSGDHISGQGQDGRDDVNLEVLVYRSGDGGDVGGSPDHSDVSGSRSSQSDSLSCSSGQVRVNAACQKGLGNRGSSG